MNTEETKKTKIAHLYYDLMNLYGESGNVKALVKVLSDQYANPEVHFLTIGDHIDFNEYDIYYIGGGSINDTLLVLNDLKQYRSDIIKAINNNKYFLVTGNAFDLFGKTITRKDNTVINALNIFDYEVKENEFRIIGATVAKTDLIKEKIIGFQNRICTNNNTTNPLFQITYGSSDDLNSKNEGIHINNFFATYLIGPLLIRNPHFTDFFIKGFTDNQEFVDRIDYKAYDEFVKNFVTNDDDK